MLTFIERGDLLSSDAQALVVPVNTVGVMGNGLALAFANRVPGLLTAYRRACRGKLFTGCTPFVYQGTLQRDDGSIVPKLFVCVPTKMDYREPSKYEWIEQSLYNIAKDYRRMGLGSIAFPAIGCGKGGLDWRLVKPMFETFFKESLLEVEVYEP